MLFINPVLSFAFDIFVYIVCSQCDMLKSTLLSKIDNFEVILGRHLTLLNKQDGWNSNVYDYINRNILILASNDTKFHIINKQWVLCFW